MKELLEPNYQVKSINKSITIHNRTKNSRIKGKHFKKILNHSLKEYGEVSYKGAVIIRYDLWEEMHANIKQLQKDIDKLKTSKK